MPPGTPMDRQRLGSVGDTPDGAIRRVQPGADRSSSSSSSPWALSFGLGRVAVRHSSMLENRRGYRGRVHLDRDGDEHMTDQGFNEERERARSRVRALAQIRASTPLPTLSSDDGGALIPTTQVPATAVYYDLTRLTEPRVHINPAQPTFGPLYAEFSSPNDMASTAVPMNSIDDRDSCLSTYQAYPLPMPLETMLPKILRKEHIGPTSVHKHANLAGR